MAWLQRWPRCDTNALDFVSVTEPQGGRPGDECAPAFATYLDPVFVAALSRLRAPLRMSSRP